MTYFDRKFNDEKAFESFRRFKKQTILSKPHIGQRGNCMQAAIASLLNLEMHEVPNFIESKDFWEDLRYFVESKGYVYEGTCSPDQKFKGIGGYVIVIGQSPRNKDISHAVIYKDGKPFFDVHPDNTFLTEEFFFLLISEESNALDVLKYFREIKFRYFKKSDKMMRADLGGLHLEQALTDHRFIVMQYTGLKDENGFELYEGDIIQNDAAKWVVIFNTGCFCAKRISGSDGTQNIHLALRAIQGKKRIGNIYENPELLDI